VGFSINSLGLTISYCAIYYFGYVLFGLLGDYLNSFDLGFGFSIGSSSGSY
jgi:hypothetical protein